MTMKAVRKTAEGPGNVALCDVPVPEIGPDDVLMKVYAAGICGSDLLIEDDKHFYRAPVTQGHEFSDIANKVGKNVKRVQEGDKFVADVARGRYLYLPACGAKYVSGDDTQPQWRSQLALVPRYYRCPGTRTIA
ncbi:MAG: alcohol dehydrogenase catalytic domain-containing protein [Proteobacteria bacterium]|nr:alcohol dehydrogenase catalytic domain-containing protein [Pseudomonadota bacterium]